MYFLEKQKKIDSNLKIAVAREFQNAVVEVLVKKTMKAARAHQVKTVMLAGGVAANQELRKELEKNLQPTSYYLPAIKNCGDNAAMIAVAGYFHAAKKNFTAFNKVKINSNWQL